MSDALLSNVMTALRNTDIVNYNDVEEDHYYEVKAEAAIDAYENFAMGQHTTPVQERTLFSDD